MWRKKEGWACGLKLYERESFHATLPWVELLSETHVLYILIYKSCIKLPVTVFVKLNWEICNEIWNITSHATASYRLSQLWLIVCRTGCNNERATSAIKKPEVIQGQIPANRDLLHYLTVKAVLFTCASMTQFSLICIEIPWTRMYLKCWCVYML